MQTLAEFPTDGAGLQGGISPGLIPYTGKFWFDAENVWFRDGGPQAMKGSELLTEFPDGEGDLGALVAIAQGYAEQNARVFVASATTVHYFTRNHRYTIESLESPSDFWSLVPFGSWLMYTNQIDHPRIWRNGAKADLPIPGDKCRLLAKLGPHIIALGIDKDIFRIAWCSADNPDDWNILSPTNTAGDLNLRDLGSGIVACAPCAGGLAIYTSDKMGLLSYLGSPFIFGFETRINGIGAVGPNAVVSVGGNNFGLSRAGVWSTDSVQFKYVDVPDIQKYLQENINWAAADRCCWFHDEANGQVVLSYPALGSVANNRAVGFCYVNQAWTRYSFGFSAGDERDVFGAALYASARELRKWGTATESDTDAWVQTKPLDFGSDDAEKRVMDLRFGWKGAATIHLGAQENLDVPIEWYESAPLASHVPVNDRETIYWSLKILGRRWAVTAIKIRGEPVGYTV